MQTLWASGAWYNFGRLFDTARAEPVTVESTARAVVVVLAVEEYGRLAPRDLPRKYISFSYQTPKMRCAASARWLKGRSSTRWL